MNLHCVRPVGSGLALLAAVGLSACLGGNNSGISPGSGTSVQVSGASPFSTACGTTSPAGTTETFASGSAIQPQVTAIPGGNVVGVWEQDRWTGLGARGVLSATSTDGGATWSTSVALPFSACGGGAGPGAGFDRASDPWVTFVGSNIVVASALAFSANSFVGNSFPSSGPDGASAVLVSRSTDGGAHWSPAYAVIDDTNPGLAPGATFYFNDRDSITADPATGNVYLVWDRLSNAATNLVQNSVPAWLAVSTNGGATWGPARILYDPGVGNEAFNNEIVVLPNGTLLDFFTLISLTSSAASLQLVRSADHGNTWSTTPVTVSPINSQGTPSPLIRDSRLMARVAVDPATGNVAAVWQQQSSSGGLFDGIALSVSKDGGNTWSTPVQINGAPSAAAFSPTVRYLPNSVLAVTYYDLRDFASGSATLSTDAWLTESNDGGTTWNEVRLQNAFDMNKAPQALDSLVGFGGTAPFLGDNQGLALVSGNPLPFYAATNTVGAHVYAAQPVNPFNSSSKHVYKSVAL